MPSLELTTIVIEHANCVEDMQKQIKCSKEGKSTDGVCFESDVDERESVLGQSTRDARERDPKVHCQQIS